MTQDNKPQWVVVPGIQGWILEHDPEKEAGLAPLGKYRERSKRDTV